MCRTCRVAQSASEHPVISFALSVACHPGLDATAEDLSLQQMQLLVLLSGQPGSVVEELPYLMVFHAGLGLERPRTGFLMQLMAYLVA